MPRRWLSLLLSVLCYGHESSAISSAPASSGIERAMAEGKALRNRGFQVEAIRSFGKAAAIARRDKHPFAEAKAYFAASGCQIRIFQYGQALASLTQAGRLAESSGDRVLLGSIAGNTAALYSQLGDFSAAERSAQQAAFYLKDSPPPYNVMSQGGLGDIEFGLNRVAEGRLAFERAIAAASSAHELDLQATFSDNYGIWLVLVGDLPAAEKFLTRAYSIRQSLGDKEKIAISHEHLAELEQRKGKPFLQSALNHINAALQSRSKELSSDPHYYPIHVRGLIYEGLGSSTAALADFKMSVDEADQWRQSALPGDTTNTRTVAQLNAVYQDYAQLAASVSLSTNNQLLAREAFSVIARNRAATLREQLTRVNRSQFLNSPQYLSLLQQLQSAQADVSLTDTKGKSEAARKNLDQIRTQLNDLENRLGLDKDFVVASLGNNRKRNLLKDIQSGLGERAALLSFTLGNAQSYLWAVTSKDLTLYQLPGRKTVEDQVRQFRTAVHEPAKRSGLATAGRALTKSLFSQLPQSIAQKPEWLIAPDGELLNAMPFAALPLRSDGTADQPLVSAHSLRILPSAMLPETKGAARKSETFLGVGDPIYNRADARYDRKSAPPPVSKPNRYNTLARLVASESELKTSAQACALPHTDLLTGRDASGSRLRQSALAVNPQILHFAVHVISPEGRPAEAALALSLTSTGIPELLTAEVVSTLRTPGALVVLSGCASQQGDIIPGSGLVGLSRSWLLAGAAAVVVSAWPTPDVSGQFFASFYNHYRRAQGLVAERAAFALQQTQLEMASTAGFRSNPDFWAAYSIVSKE